MEVFFVVFQKFNPYLRVCPNRVGYFNHKMRFPNANSCIIITTTEGSATRKRLGEKETAFFFKDSRRNVMQDLRSWCVSFVIKMVCETASMPNPRKVKLVVGP